MTPQASNKTAAIAGAWCVFGLIPFEYLMNHHKPSSVLLSNLAWLTGMAIFFIVPAYFFVIGKGNAPFRRTWFLNAEERARYAVVEQRMLVWSLSAGVVGTFWSLIFGAFF